MWSLPAQRRFEQGRTVFWVEGLTEEKCLQAFFFFFNSKLKSLHFCPMMEKVGEGQGVELTYLIISFNERR